MFSTRHHTLFTYRFRSRTGAIKQQLPSDSTPVHREAEKRAAAVRCGVSLIATATPRTATVKMQSAVGRRHLALILCPVYGMDGRWRVLSHHGRTTCRGTSRCAGRRFSWKMDGQVVWRQFDLNRFVSSSSVFSSVHRRRQ